MVKYLIIISILTGCAAPDCPEAEKYIGHYETITYPDGSVITRPVWFCP